MYYLLLFQFGRISLREWADPDQKRWAARVNSRRPFFSDNLSQKCFTVILQTVDSVCLYKAGAKLYDRNRFAPVLFRFIFTRFSAVRREAWWPGEQILKVIVWFQAVCFCGFRYAVDDRTEPGAGNCVDHDPILFPDTESTDRPFGKLFTYKDNFPKMQSVRLWSAEKGGCSAIRRSELRQAQWPTQWQKSPRQTK